MRFLPLSSVRLADGPFRRAVDVDLAYALDLDPARLLAPFRREAGLPAVAPSYGNWEDSGLDGHIGGHYLSALSLLWAATGDERVMQRLDAVVAELALCQRESGYVGGIPGGEAAFAALATGGRDAVASLGSSEHWVPWYNLHKTFQGLIDAHVVGERPAALPIVRRLADWWLAIADRLDDELFELMLETEFGGMNDAFAQLAAITGRSEYATQAERFAHRATLDPLRRGEDALTGQHANTQIPKVVGYASTALATGDDDYRRAAEFFWRTVVDHRTVAIGGNSVREHFHTTDDFTPMIDEREGPESCNTYNMLKLTRALAEQALQPEHLDYAERALFNHVLGSQHPERGGFVYFTPMRPRHYRVYSQPQEGFWCCVGTGLEAQARYGEWVFGVEGDALAVNLYLPAVAEVPEFGGRIRVDADLPASGAVTVTLDLDAPRAFALRLRVPGWAAELGDLHVAGAPIEGRAVPGAVVIERTWQPGDEVTFTLPIDVRIEPLPAAAGGGQWQAYLSGPSVLAARAGTARLDGLYADDSRMGHIAHGPLLPLDEVEIVAAGAADAERLRLEPFAGIHDERYTVYWPVVAPGGDVDGRRAQLQHQDELLDLDAATVDAIAFGEQQPESDHAFHGAETKVVATDGGRWRVTTAQIGARLRVRGGDLVRVQYLAGEDATSVIVTLNGVEVGRERFESGAGSLEIDYPLAGRADIDSATIVFAAAEGLSTPRIGTVRVLAPRAWP